MSQSIKSDNISESTIARIAGNLLSGQELPGTNFRVQQDSREHMAAKAVAMARAIAAEVRRTAPSPAPAAPNKEK